MDLLFFLGCLKNRSASKAATMIMENIEKIRNSPFNLTYPMSGKILEATVSTISTVDKRKKNSAMPTKNCCTAVFFLNKLNKKNTKNGNPI